MKDFKLSHKTEQIIFDLAPEFFLTDNPEGSYEDMCNIFKQTGRMKVFEGGSDDTIFSGRTAIHTYRAWHDLLHYIFGLDFEADSEIQVGCLQQGILQTYGVKLFFAALTKWEIVLHVCHFHYHKGAHPEAQTNMLEEFFHYCERNNFNYYSIYPNQVKIIAKSFISKYGKF